MFETQLRALLSRFPVPLRQVFLDRKAQAIYQSLLTEGPRSLDKPFFLYLRSFHDDSAADANWLFEREGRNRKIHRTTTGVIAALLEGYGPLVQVRKPGFGLLSGKGLGQIRLGGIGDDWVVRVEYLIVHANAIFMRPMDTPGVLREFSLLRKQDFIKEKTFLLVDPDDDYATLPGRLQRLQMSVELETQHLALAKITEQESGKSTYRERSCARLKKYNHLIARIKEILAQEGNEKNADLSSRLTMKMSEWSKLRNSLRAQGFNIPVQTAYGGIYSFFDESISLSFQSISVKQITDLFEKLYLNLNSIGSSVIESDELCPCNSGLYFSECHRMPLRDVLRRSLESSRIC